PGLTAAEGQVDMLDRSAGETETDGALPRRKFVVHGVLRVRPLAVARGGRSTPNKQPGKGHSEGTVCPFRHQSPRCVVGSASAKLHDALSVKALRCVVGSQVGISALRFQRPRAHGAIYLVMWSAMATRLA